MTWKIADLGLARLLDPDNPLSDCGTPGHMAPEMPTGRYDAKVDVWSTAATFIRHLSRLVSCSEVTYNICRIFADLIRKPQSSNSYMLFTQVKPPNFDFHTCVKSSTRGQGSDSVYFCNLLLYILRGFRLLV